MDNLKSIMLNLKYKMAELEKENADKQILPGMEVEDIWGNKGIVVRVENGMDIITDNKLYTVRKDQLFITVWQSEQYDYSFNNCENYPGTYWKSTLRVIL